MENTLEDKVMAAVGAAGIAIMGLLVGLDNNFYTGRRTLPEVSIESTEKYCEDGTPTYRITERSYFYAWGIPIPFTDRKFFHESEYTCAMFDHPADGYMLQAEREIFPDGRVNVLWDPGNKYTSSNPFPSGNYR